MSVYDDSWESFPPQSVRAINNSPVNVAVKVNGVTKPCEPFGSVVIPAKPQGNRPIVGVHAAYEAGDGEWEIIAGGGSKILLAHTRLTTMLFPDAGGLASAQGAGSEESSAPAQIEMVTYSFGDSERTKNQMFDESMSDYYRNAE